VDEMIVLENDMILMYMEQLLVVKVLLKYYLFLVENENHLNHLIGELLMVDEMH
jgi:hypothetical protein